MMPDPPRRYFKDPEHTVRNIQKAPVKRHKEEILPTPFLERDNED